MADAAELDESAIIWGKVSNAVTTASTAIMIGQPDWTDILVDLPQGMEKNIPRGTRVQAVVTRTEDGLEARPDDIEIMEE